MSEFLTHVKHGLGKTPKSLSSKYFYDECGDRLFQEIMTLKEYYLPDREMSIISSKSRQIAMDLSKFHSSYRVVELGAGDGSKTKHFLELSHPVFKNIEYVALDISEDILKVNEKEISTSLPDLKISSVPGDYFQTFSDLPLFEGGTLILYLGSNIGNLDFNQAEQFLRTIQHCLQPNDFLLVAFDLIKDPRKIIKAYDDERGVTKAFNLNLLARINRQLGADFDLSKFDHFPFYNPATGIVASYVVSLAAQKVTLKDGTIFSFDKYETIHTEISKKYSLHEIKKLADASGFSILKTYYDTKEEYVFALLHKDASESKPKTDFSNPGGFHV